MHPPRYSFYKIKYFNYNWTGVIPPMFWMFV